MTKELELLVKKWRDDGIRLNGGANKPYSDDENSVRAFVLEHCAEELAAALAKAQEGLSLADAEKVLRESSGHAWEFMGDSIVVSLDTAIATLTAQQKAPEGEEECETCEGRGWHDERLGGYSFSNPKAPCPDCDGTGQLSDSAAPGGDVPYDRELIASMLDAAVRGNSGYSPDFMTKQAELLRAADRAIENGAADAMHWIDRYAAGWDAECQLDKVAAALSAPKQVGVSCAGELLDGLSDTFKGDDLQLLSSARSLLDLDKSGALVPHGIGGHARGIIEAFIVRMAYAPQAAQVPVEGEGREQAIAALISAAKNVDREAWGKGVGNISFAAVGRLTAALNDARLPSPPREQPAVELGGWINDPDSIPKKIINACRDAILIEFGNNGTDGYYKRILARVFVALIDGAKAGRVDHG